MLNLSVLAGSAILALFLGALIGSHIALYRALWLIVTRCLGCDKTIHDAAYDKGFDAGYRRAFIELSADTSAQGVLSL